MQQWAKRFALVLFLTMATFAANAQTIRYVKAGGTGDIDGTASISANDAYHVIISADAVGDALLDGFSVTGGNANGSGTIYVNGRGINRTSGGGIYNDYSSPIINNSIVWGNGGSSNIFNTGSSSPAYNYSLIEGMNLTGSNGLDGNLYTTDDIFTNATAGDYSLQPTSPAINAGDNDLYLTARGIEDFSGEKDLAGKTRLVDARIDMGAYEYNDNIEPIVEINTDVPCEGDFIIITFTGYEPFTLDYLVNCEDPSIIGLPKVFGINSGYPLNEITAPTATTQGIYEATVTAGQAGSFVFSLISVSDGAGNVSTNPNTVCP